MELPPRARRIPWEFDLKSWLDGTTSACAENTTQHHVDMPYSGTTSACAENTRCFWGFQLRQWNYLRVRGEYSHNTMLTCHTPELPPRARRILVENMLGLSRYGTTSACAENTVAMAHGATTYWNYLRVRGEYLHSIVYTNSRWELPPRARRILGDPTMTSFGRGTTSACAENTVENRIVCPRTRNYLRVRGEYRVRDARIRWEPELPPRARRIP